MPTIDDRDVDPAECLAQILQRYAATADAVNRREMQRFVSEPRSLWHPRPDGFESDEEYRYTGWTNEGAFTRCLYDKAFNHSDRPRALYDRPNEEKCEAKLQNQVQFRPTVDQIMELVESPRKSPARAGIRREMLRNLTHAVRIQVQKINGADDQVIDLPADVQELYALTDGVRIAGVPSETENSHLFFPIGSAAVLGKLGELPNEVALRADDHMERYREKVVAAWNLGGGSQFRRIYYVLCRSEGQSLKAARWRIWDRVDVSVDVYEDLATFLAHETLDIKTRQGGGRQTFVLSLDRHP